MVQPKQPPTKPTAPRSRREKLATPEEKKKIADAALNDIKGNEAFLAKFKKHREENGVF